MRNLKRALSLTLASVMLLGMMVVGTSAKGYDDVDENDNVEAIEVLQTIEVMVGDDRGFGPDRPVTRNEMAVVMGKLLNLNYNYYASSCPFTDVAEWARGWVGACYANGIVSGRGDGIYDGEATVTAIEAASMMMRALGYFKYAEDYADGFQLVTVRQGSEIGIFNDVGTDGNTAMTRNQVAQMALNALRSEMVTFTGTPGIEVNGVKVGYKAEYTSRTGTDSKYDSIEGMRTTIAGDNSQYYIQLGEQLYDGDLVLRTTLDDFGRPARYWEYDGKEIGTYAKKEMLKAEYTEKVTGKTLYDLLGSSTLNRTDYDLLVSIDGNIGNDPENFDKGDLTRTNTDAVGGTGNGVLTQVYVDTQNHDIYIAIINTYLAIAEDDYNEKKDEVSLTVYALDVTGTLYSKDDPDNDTETIRKISGDDFDIKDIKEDDKFLVTVAAGEIKSIDAPEVLSDETINSYSKGNYVVAGQQYDYATTAQYDNEVMDDYSAANMKDITYNIVLDKYGYLIGIEENESPNQYVFLTGIEDDFSNLYNKKVDANVIFLDGTMKTVTVDPTKGNLSTALTPAIDDANDHGSVANTWCTYSVSNDNVYTLDVVDTTGAGAKVYQAKQDASPNVEISSKYVSLTGAGAFTRVYGNDNTVYIDAEMDTVVVNDTSETSLIIKDVKSVTTGVTNVDLEVSDLTTGATNYEPTNEVYTLHKDNGYIIAVVTLDADDKATSKSYVYVSSDDIHKRDWDADDQEYTWYREVILDGAFTDLIEVTDTTSSVLDGLSQDTWYEVSFNADGHVKSAVAVDFESGASPAGTTDSDHIGFVDATQIDESVDNIDNTVILTATMSSNKLSIAGNTLYTTANHSDDGVYVSPSAKIIVFPNNSDDEFNDPETYTSLERAVNSLEDKDNFDGYIHAVIGKDGVATVVIIDEENVPAVDPMTLTVNFIYNNTNVGTTTYSWNGTGTASSVATAAGIPGGYSFVSGTLPTFREGRTGIFNVTVAAEGEDEFTVYVTFKAGSTTVGTANQEVTLTKNTKGVAFLTNDGLVDENGDSIVPDGYEVDGTLNELVNADNMAFNVPVKVATRNIKLPADYKIEYAADPGGLWVAESGNTYDATKATNGIEVPVGAAVTVTVPASVSTWYVVDPTVATVDNTDSSHFKTAAGTFTIAAGTTDLDYKTALADKYYKVKMADFTEAATAGVTFAASGETEKFMKSSDTFEITVTSTAGGTATDAVNAAVTADNSVTTDVSAEEVVAAGTVDANFSKAITVTPVFSGASAKDITLTLALST